MSSQAQGILEGETAGPSYGTEGRERGQLLLNGPISSGPAFAGYGSADRSDAGQGPLESVTVSDDVMQESAQDIHGAHNAHRQIEQQQKQQPTTLPNPSEAVSTPLLRSHFPGDPSPLPSPAPVPLRVHAQDRAGQPRGSQTPSQVVESTQSVTVRMTTSPPEELPDQNETRGTQAVWMVRLGEFFQRRVNQAAAVVAPVLERPSRSAMTRPFMTPPSSWTMPSPRAQQAPLFSQEAERAMQQWPQQAPLLHGSVAGVGQRDAESSSGSLTQEQVLAEVRKQVQVAMQAHTREMVSLREENENLRAIVAQSERANPRLPTTMPFLRGGNPARTPGEGDRRDGAQGDGLVGLPRGLHGEGGQDGRLREGGGVIGPPPGLAEARQEQRDGHHGPEHERGGDPAPERGSRGVLGGHAGGGHREVLPDQEAQATASKGRVGLSAPDEGEVLGLPEATMSWL